jgi:hypothetical protein
MIKEKILKNDVKDLSQSVQDYYNGLCAAVDINNAENLNEVIELIKMLI